MSNRPITIFILFLIISLPLFVLGQARNAYYISGIVRDSITMDPVPYASVAISEKATGTLTDEKGIFELTAPNNATSLQIACLGYDKKIVPIRKGKVNMYDILLSPISTELKEVVIRRKKIKKKDNPAYAFVKRLKEAGSLTDPERNPYYNYNKHEIISMALNDFVDKDEGSWLFKRFPFLWDHVDTSEVSGKPILNFLIKEKASEMHYRHNPKSTKEVINGLRQEGVDEVFDQGGSMLTLLEDVLREIDLYKGDITLLQNRFVSPLSRIAPDFYKFYLTDTVEVADEKCIVLSFYPHNTASFGFNGQVFVVADDSTMFIKKVTMRTPHNINLNFIQNLYISQEFERAEDGSRLKKNDDLTIEIKVAPGTPGIYARRTVAYDNHNFNVPEDLTVFNQLGSSITSPEAKIRNDEYWDEARIMTVTTNERRVNDLMGKLRQAPLFYWTEKVLKVLFMGYLPTGNPSKFDFGPVNTLYSHNSTEGWRFRVGGMTTANLNNRWFWRGYVAYGTKDHKWKYKSEVEYSFLEKEYHSREFPQRALKFTSQYDIDQLGQHYQFTNMDNFFLSLKRMDGLGYATYRRLNKLEYVLELANNFSIKASISNEQQQATHKITFIDGYGKKMSHYNETFFDFEIRFAPGEKFYQANTYRVPINLDAPIFTLKQKVAPKNWFGSNFMVNSTELCVQKRFWFSAFGYTDIIVKGGHVWSRSPFPDLLIPNANLSYTIQPESYALMNPMEFINDSYAAWDVTYWLNGALFNFIPGFKKLKLREVVNFKGLWGHLSNRNDPLNNPDMLQLPADLHTTRMTNTPYMEISAGIDNIFRCLRVDYAWRLNYLNVPYRIDRRGLRIAVHLAF